MAGTPVGDGASTRLRRQGPPGRALVPPVSRETASGIANEGGGDIRAAEKGAEEDGGGEAVEGGGGPPPGGDGDRGPWSGSSTGGCQRGSRRWHQRPGGSPLMRIAQMLVASARRWGVEVPVDRSRLHESGIEGQPKLEHTEQFVCLDKAAVETPEDRAPSSSAWRLCVSLRYGVAMPVSPSSPPPPCFRSPPPPFRPRGPPRRARPLPPMNWIDPLAAGEQGQFCLIKPHSSENAQNGQNGKVAISARFILAF
uniref:Uncharacterized protein n=1 Tax=Oryza meridionalis TaxID=40149 RepID=A0A0E0DE81_9ORYZ